MSEKPLFIPLATRFYRQFEAGTKTYEMRKYGPRWNEKTCEEGRSVVLSLGYGKKNRMCGLVEWFKRIPAHKLGMSDAHDVMQCYGTLDIDIAMIGVTDLIPLDPDKSY